MNKNDHHTSTNPQQVIGVVPMAGRATRLANLPCSKEIYPTIHRATDNDRQPCVVCEHLLTKMRRAGMETVFVILRDGKWDIPAYLGDGSKVGLQLAYLMMGLPYGTPYSVDQAFPFVRQSMVAVGFPDMIFGPEDVFTPLFERQQASAAEVVLGLFPADRPDKADMVELDDKQNVRQIIIKPAHTNLRYAWGIAVWTPAFTDFMHQYLARHQKTATDNTELFIGDVVQAAIENGMHVQGVQVSKHPFLDIGTWDDLSRAIASPRD